MKLQTNLCKLDRFLRGIIALAIFYVAIFEYPLFNDPIVLVLLLIFASLNFISFVTSWCPVYQLANISTCKRQ